MKLLFIATAPLILTTAFAADFNCTGAKGTKGAVTLSNPNNSAITVVGSYAADETGTTKTFANCTSMSKGTVSAFNYFGTKKNQTCPADYVRVPSNLEQVGKGLIALVDTTGADNHDYSGYAYQYFFCTQK